jgi:hypothetical protein
MADPILGVLKVFNPEAEISELRGACRRLVDWSDLIRCASEPFTDADIEAITEGVFQFILNPGGEELREIMLPSRRGPIGKTIEYTDFASLYSSDFLYQYAWAKWDDPQIRDHWSAGSPVPYQHCWADRKAPSTLDRGVLWLAEYYAAILFRYASCVQTDMAAFPVSEAVNFARLGDALLVIRGGREANLPGLLYLVMLALQSRE